MNNLGIGSRVKVVGRFRHLKDASDNDVSYEQFEKEFLYGVIVAFLPENVVCVKVEGTNPSLYCYPNLKLIRSA